MVETWAARFRPAAVLLFLLAITFFTLNTSTFKFRVRKNGTSLPIPSAPLTVYGHVHIAKTAGTTLNGRMASRFDNVCGHKGYSVDYYQSQTVFEGSVGPVD